MKSLSKHKALSDLMGMLMPSMLSRPTSKKDDPKKATSKMKKKLVENFEDDDYEEEKPAVAISLTELSSMSRPKNNISKKKKVIRRTKK